jgi:hypothetical protein
VVNVTILLFQKQRIKLKTNLKRDKSGNPILFYLFSIKSSSFVAKPGPEELHVCMHDVYI